MTLVVSETFGTRTSLGSLGTLANGTYINVGTITPGGAVDTIVELEATPGTVSSLYNIAVFIQASLDGTNFTTGPIAGTTTTDESNLLRLGVLPLNSNSTLQRIAFSVVAALGFMPVAFKVICKNQTGAALASGTVYYTNKNTVLN